MALAFVSITELPRSKCMVAVEGEVTTVVQLIMSALSNYPILECAIISAVTAHCAKKGIDLESLAKIANETFNQKNT